MTFPSKKTRRRFYGHGVPGVDLEELAGKLIVVEGADGSGRSTQIARLVDWLEGGGHATVQVGLETFHAGQRGIGTRRRRAIF